MSLENVTIQVSPQTAEVLRMLQSQAEARQLPLDVYLRTLAEGANGATPAQNELTPEERARLWCEWVERNAVYVNHFVDDSRESIYAETESEPLALSPEEKIAFLRDWIAGLERNTPLLSDAAVSREGIYAPEV